MSHAINEPAVVLKGVTFHYQERPGAPPVVEEVSLEVFHGDFLGLIGPNGGGKTTLLRIMLGLLTPQSGSVRVLGRPPREVSREIGYVPQHAMVDAQVPATVLDVVLTGRLGLSSWGPFYRKQDLAAVRSALELVGIGDLEGSGIGALSGGQRQRVLIARALAAEAKILFLDEPMAGVDLHMEKGILELLKQLNARIPIVLVSHDLGFISAHVKRVACMNRRLLVHAPGEINREIIAEMYQSQGPVQQVHHQAACPVKPKLKPENGESP